MKGGLCTYRVQGAQFSEAKPTGIDDMISLDDPYRQPWQVIDLAYMGQHGVQPCPQSLLRRGAGCLASAQKEKNQWKVCPSHAKIFIEVIVSDPPTGSSSNK